MKIVHKLPIIRLNYCTGINGYYFSNQFDWKSQKTPPQHSFNFYSFAFFLCLFLQFSLFSQSRLVLKDDAYLVLNTSSTTDSVFVVLDNGNANALSTSGTGGNIITKHEKNQIKWNIGTNTGTYTVPFTTATNASNDNGNNKASESKTPLDVTIDVAGTGSGNIKFSSYTDNTATNNYLASDYKPSDVTNMNNSSAADNSANVVDRFWIMDANGYTAKPDVTLSFTYDDQEAASDPNNTISESDIFPQRWNSTASSWSDVTLSGTLNTTANTLSAVTVTKANFFRSWVLVNSLNPLPVELISFESKCINNQTVLHWTTGAEINNAHFEIQHSTDGAQWKSIDTVQGAGNSSVKINYEHPVKINSNQDINYYRLKQVDYDGTYAHSKVKFCSCGVGRFEITNLYPNPSNGEVNIVLNSTEGGTLILTIYDALGKLIINNVLTIQEGNNVINNVIQGGSGKYFISATLSNGKYYDYGVIVIK